MLAILTEHVALILIFVMLNMDYYIAAFCDK